MRKSTSDWQLSDYQIKEIKKGLAEADAGDFATDEEMAQVIKKWTNKGKSDSPASNKSTPTGKLA